jgi:hypothetical protein
VNKRWAPRGDLPGQESSYLPDFSDTISHQLDETQRGLKILDPHRAPTTEYLSFQREVIQAQTEEIRILREQVAKLVTTSNLKASKRALEQLSTDLGARLDKRVDSIRNWSAIALTAIGVCLAVATFLGHR